MKKDAENGLEKCISPEGSKTRGRTVIVQALMVLPHHM